MGEAKANKEEVKKGKNKPDLKKNVKEPKKATKKEVLKESVKKAPVVKKETKGTFVSRMKKFFKGAYSELKKVHWPTKQQIIAFTTVVVASVLFIAVLIWVIDAGLTQIIKLVLKK